MAFSSEAGDRALAAAVATVEARSQAELVIVVRPVAGNYLGHELLVGDLVALVVLGLLLWSPLAPIWMLLCPTAAVVAVVFGLRAMPWLRRRIVSDARRQAATREAAALSFFAKRIRHTSERTGVLVFVALFEQKVEILADTGILASVPRGDWREAEGLIEAVFHDRGDAVVLAKRIEQALGPRLERWCAARPDRVNELPDEITS